MKSIDGNEPAFPLYCVPGDLANTSGMTLRDYFAAKAMPQLISLCQDGDGGWSQDNVAQGAYLLADAMLKAREA